MLVIEPTEESLPMAVKAVLAYAVALKLNWVASPYNLNRLRNGQIPRDCSVGLHKGLVTVGPRPLPERVAPEGFAISLCKRIQQAASHAEATRILATLEFESACRTWLPAVRFKKPVLTDVKGKGANVRAAEVESLVHSDLVHGAGTAVDSLTLCTGDEVLKLLKSRALENPGEIWVVRTAAVAHLFRAIQAGNEWPDRARFLKAAIKIWPEFAEVHNSLGLAYNQLGQHDKAATEFEEAIRLTPDFAFAYSNLGETYASLGRFDKAVEECSKAISLDSQLPHAYYTRAVAKFHLGDKDSAAADFMRACILQPWYKERPLDGWKPLG